MERESFQGVHVEKSVIFNVGDLICAQDERSNILQTIECLRCDSIQIVVVQEPGEERVEHGSNRPLDSLTIH